MKERDINLRQDFSAVKEAAIFEEPARRGERTSPLRAIPRPASLPLSFSQQRLWFLEQLSPGNALNNLPLIFRLHGTLRHDVLRESLNELVRRHEVLRTTIRLEGGQPVQVVAPTLTLELPCWEVLQTGADQEKEVWQYISREGSYLFDLEQEPLVRASFLRLSASEHILLLVIHHILCDGWSFNILHQELSQLHAAFSAGETSPLAPLSLQYADYTLWQRQEMQGERLERELSYWQSRLQDVPVLALPTDRPRSQESSVRGAQFRFTLPSELTRNLRELSRREGGSLFQALLAAFQVVLSQYSGLTDITVGTPAANRTQHAVEGMVGCFINMLVMRTNLTGDPSWREVLARTKRMVQEGKEHQDLPFEKLVERLRLERHVGQHPLYQVIITLRHRVRASFEAGDLRIDLPELGPTQATQGELALAFDVEGEQVQGTLDYAVDLFNEETMQRLVGHLHTALAAMVAHPEQRLSEVSLLTKDEWRRLVVEWNATQCLYPREQCVHERFEEQARCTPNAVALVCGEQSLTYEHLNRRANQVAHLLRTHGVGPEVLVGLSVERSLEMVVGMLGILKAGGAYVPMDPALPATRLVYLLEETQVKVGLTQKRVRERLPEAPLTWLLLDPEEESLAQQSEETPVSGVCSANLAYVLFTSGSTGQPKGVQLAHSGVSNLITWWQRFAALSPHDQVTQFANMGFDVSVWETWSVLCSGGSLFIIEESQFMGPSQLYQYIKLEGITVSWLPTPLAELMLHSCYEYLLLSQ